MPSPLSLSIIIPVYNESGNLIRLFEKLLQALGKDKPWEVIFVNDGSNDGSLKEIKELAVHHPQVAFISFTRNFGQTAAFAAGIQHARGELIVTMDADLQNDPTDIPTMVELIHKKKADIVAGWRKHRQDPFLRSILSKFANAIIKKATGANIHDTGCSLRVYKKEIIQHVKLYGEMHRFIPALAHASGAKIVEMPVQHYPRTIGKSKYGLMRTFKVLLDLLTVKFLTTYQTKPIYMFGVAGFGFWVLSFLTGVVVAIRAIFFQGVWVSPLFVLSALLFTYGFLSIMMGLLAEIQIRTWYESSDKQGYLIKEISIGKK